MKHDVPMIPTLINGNWTLILPEHRAVRPQWVTGWERERLDSMHANLKPGMTIFDIGAEEGDLPALWASWGCKVAMVEPNPKVWPNIKAIWDANDLPEPLVAFAGFAGAANYIPAGGEGQSSVWPESVNGPLIGDHGFCVIPERPDIPIVTIDSLALECEPPQAITMDVEGAELEVVKGASETLRLHRPMVWISIHPQFMEDTFGQTDTQLHDYMDDHDYEGKLLAIDHEEHWLFTPEG